MATIIPLTDVRAAVRADALATFVRNAADAPMAPGPLVDQRGRPLSDLRISVTDRCNFRCVYCMPKDVFGSDYAFLPHAQLLTFEEITRVASVFAAMGVRKIRLTGGEPLLRRKIERLVEMLRGIGDLDLTLTTNGALLARKAQDLRDAGLSRVTVSLDSLDDATFRAMNDVDFPVAKVQEGIAAAAAAGLAPLKINMVVKRGTNEASIVPMARHFKGSGHIVRFIEYMDVGATGEVAERWRYRDGDGEIGVIASVTQAFCRDCTRARLSTDGKVYTCLFATDGHDLRALLREGASDDAIGNAIAAIWRQRADRYSEVRTANTARLPKVEMSYIGG
jgi:cyclic pyranopterin phosphate synthase